MYLEDFSVIVDSIRFWFGFLKIDICLFKKIVTLMARGFKSILMVFSWENTKRSLWIIANCSIKDPGLISMSYSRESADKNQLVQYHDDDWKTEFRSQSVMSHPFFHIKETTWNASRSFIWILKIFLDTISFPGYQSVLLKVNDF